MNARETYLQKLALAGKLITPVSEADLIAGPWSKFKDGYTGGTYKLPWKEIYVQTHNWQQAEQVFRAVFEWDPFEQSCCIECGQDFVWLKAATFTSVPTWFKSVLWIKEVDFEGIFEAADAVILQDILAAPTAPSDDLNLDADGNVVVASKYESWTPISDSIASTVLQQEFKKKMTAWTATLASTLGVPAEFLGHSGYPIKTKYSLNGFDSETTAPKPKYIKGPDYKVKP